MFELKIHVISDVLQDIVSSISVRDAFPFEPCKVMNLQSICIFSRRVHEKCTKTKKLLGPPFLEHLTGTNSLATHYLSRQGIWL